MRLILTLFPILTFFILFAYLVPCTEGAEAKVNSTSTSSNVTFHIFDLLPEPIKTYYSKYNSSNKSNLSKIKVLKSNGDSSTSNRRESRALEKTEYNVETTTTTTTSSSLQTATSIDVKKDNRTAIVSGIRILSVEKGTISQESSGVTVVMSNIWVKIRLFGMNFTRHTMIRFAKESSTRGEDCDDLASGKTFTIDELAKDGLSALITAKFLPSVDIFYTCARENDTDAPWIHQGPDPWLNVRVYETFLPFWAQIVFIVILLILSGLFAGLTLGLLALDQTDLKILLKTGTKNERAYARTILPLRNRGNYLLCSLVLGNVLVNSTLTILMDDLTSSLVAVLLSTMAIVIFGEIIPQAVCSRFGLAIGAKTVWLTKFLMLITFPVSYSFSFVLDKILGEEIGLIYNRERLKELIAVTLEHNDLETDEVNIISGALEMRKKTVMDIMTKIQDIFMLPIDGILDCETLGEIRKQGYSRIPIYDRERSNIVSLLLTKDLVFVDPADKIPLKTLTQFYNNPCFFAFAPTTLDVVFKEFKECQKGHMAFVQKINSSSEDRDPFCETIGIVTMEDVIEELIQSEIVDETDVWSSRSPGKSPMESKRHYLTGTGRINQNVNVVVPPLALSGSNTSSGVNIKYVLTPKESPNNNSNCNYKEKSESPTLSTRSRKK